MSEANDILKRINITSGLDVNYKETVNWYDGTPMDDSKCDGIIFRKKEDKYYERQFLRDIEPTEPLDQTSVQFLINYAASKKKRLILPFGYNFNPASYTIPNGITVDFKGPTNELRLFQKNESLGGTAVNEIEYTSPYHQGLIVGTYDNVSAPETLTRRASSIVVRRNGFSSFQKYYSVNGNKNHILDYKGYITILIGGDSITGGILTVRILGVDYNVTIPALTNLSGILTILNNFDFGPDITHKTIFPNYIILHRKNHSVHTVSKNPLTGTYSFSVDGVNYSISILNTDSAVNIAQKIVSSGILPADKYVLYQQGSQVVINQISGAVDISRVTTASIVNNTTDVIITSTVTGYDNNYNVFNITETGKVSVGMWNARDYNFEVANGMRILADSDINNSQNATAILVMENEAVNQRKLFYLRSNGDYDIMNNANSTALMKITDAGAVTFSGITRVLRLTFTGSTRDIRVAPVGAEQALYVTNNTGSGFIARFTDANLLELNDAGTYRKVLYKKSNAVADVSSPDATDLQSALVLVNELKTKLNAKLAADRDSGQQS